MFEFRFPKAIVDTNSLSIMCKKFHLGDPEQGRGFERLWRMWEDIEKKTD